MSKLEERVHAAIDQLVATGKDPEKITVRDIQNIMITGSLSTMAKYRATWQASRANPAKPLSQLIDERIGANLPSKNDFKKLLTFVESIAGLPEDSNVEMAQRQRERIKAKADDGLKELIAKYLRNPV